MVGREGEGWTYATRLLEHERSMVGKSNRTRAALARIREVAAEQRAGAGTLLEDPSFADKLARLEIRLQAASFMQLRAVADATAGARPGPESSLLKIVGTEIAQDITHLGMSALGYAAIDKDASDTANYFDNRRVTIFSGSNEIQRNIVAKRIPWDCRRGARVYGFRAVVRTAADKGQRRAIRRRPLRFRTPRRAGAE